MGCYNDDVLYIHIPKTGGTSIKTWLFDHGEGFEGHDSRDPAKDSVFPIGHIPMRDIERFTGRPLTSWKLILAVLRDPYEQQLSQWVFWRDRYARMMYRGSDGQLYRKTQPYHIHDICAASHPTIETWLADPGSDFRIWYEARHGNRPNHSTRSEDLGGYYHWWLTVDGELPGPLQIVDIAEIDEKLPTMLAPHVGEMPPLPRLNKGPGRADPVEYYTPEAAALVERKFSWAFDQIYTPWSES